MTDRVVEAVRKDLLDRSQIGVKKYGVTLDRNDLSLKEWLQHAYEECLDQANYLKKTILTIEAEEWATKVLAEKRNKHDQGWEDFREGAFNAWKKKENERLAKEATERFPITLEKLDEKIPPNESY